MFIPERKDVYLNQMVSLKNRNSKKSTDSCPSSAGDPHEQFGRYSGASLQSLFQEIMGPNLQILILQERFLKYSRTKVAHQNSRDKHPSKNQFLGVSLSFSHNSPFALGLGLGRKTLPFPLSLV